MGLLRKKNLIDLNDQVKPSIPHPDILIYKPNSRFIVRRIIWIILGLFFFVVIASNLILGAYFAVIPLNYTDCLTPGVCAGQTAVFYSAHLVDESLWAKMGISFKGSEKSMVYTKQDQTGPDGKQYVFHTNIQIPDNKDMISTYLLKSPTVNPVNNKNFIFAVHGITSDWTWTAMLSQYFLNAGFNVIVFDQQGVNTKIHDSFGNYGSTGSAATFGLKESWDLHNLFLSLVTPLGMLHQIVTNPILGWSGTIKNIGFYGMSMGASTVVMYLGKYASGDILQLPTGGHMAAIEDSGYADTMNEIMYVFSKFAIWRILVIFGGMLYVTMFAGFNPYDVSPISEVRKNTTIAAPLYVVHGTIDSVVPFSNANVIFLSYSQVNPNSLFLICYGENHGETLQYNYNNSPSDIYSGVISTSFLKFYTTAFT